MHTLEEYEATIAICAHLLSHIRAPEAHAERLEALRRYLQRTFAPARMSSERRATLWMRLMRGENTTSEEARALFVEADLAWREMARLEAGYQGFLDVLEQQLPGARALLETEGLSEAVAWLLVEHATELAREQLERELSERRHQEQRVLKQQRAEIARLLAIPSRNGTGRGGGR